jgi:sodium-dependent dicarboxylate transporter 2/3/5
VVLTRVAFRVSRERVPILGRIVTERIAHLGPMNAPQYLLLAIFALAALGWITSTWTKVPDAVIAIAAAIALFVVPAFAPSGTPRALLTWREAERIPWGVLLLFGGGLSLAEAIDVSGLDDALANLGAGLDGIPLLLILFVIALVTIVLTEFSNNTALVAAALPIGQSLAPALGVPPAVLLVTITLTASLGFAMPGGTAPNALAYSTGMVPMRSMVRAGIILDALVAIVVPLLVYGAYKMGILPGM